MENINKNLDFMDLTGNVKDMRIINNTQVGIFSVVQKHLTESYFHTSRGYIKVDPVVSIICVEHAKGKMELLAGIKMLETVQMINYLIEKNFTIAELPTEVAKIRNYRAIIRTVENKLKFEAKQLLVAKEAENKEIENKEIETTVVVEPIKKQLPKMKTLSDIPSYREVALTVEEKKIMQSIVHTKDIASSFFNKSKIINIFSKTK
jgi:hypothetical protein